MRRYATLPALVAVTLVAVLAVAVPPAAAGDLLTDDFNDGNATGWTAAIGTWSVSSNRYVNTATGATETLTSAGQGTWSDYAVTATMRVTTATASTAPGVLARFQSASTFYLFYYSTLSGAFVMRKKVSNTWSTLTTGSAFTLVTNTDYRLKLEVTGSTLKGFVDSGSGFVQHGSTVTDSAIASGAVGLRNYEGTTQFDDVSVDSTGGGAPGAPSPAISTLAATVINAHTVKLTWTDSAPASYYDIRFATSTITEGTFGAASQLHGEPVPDAVNSVRSHLFTGLTQGTTYYIAMKLGSANKSLSALSNVVTVAMPPGTLAAPSGLAATIISDKVVDLAWTDNSTGEREYIIDRKVSGGSYGVVGRFPPNSTKFRDWRATPGTTYFYRVRSVASPTISPNSNEVSVTMPAAVTLSTAIKVSQAGFKPESDKTFLVIGNASTTFEVRQATTDAVVVSSTALATLTNDPLVPSGTSAKRGDLTTLRTPGAYRIVLSDGSRSAMFEIKEQLYDDYLALSFMQLYRTRLPEDIFFTRVDTGEPINMGKGWEDAWDDRHWQSSHDGNEPIALNALYERTAMGGWNGNTLSSLNPSENDLLEELRWGADFLLRTYHEQAHGWAKQGQIFVAQTDAVLDGTGSAQLVNVDDTDDLGGYERVNLWLPAQFQFVAGLAATARRFDGIDNYYRDRLRDAALGAWANAILYDDLAYVKNAQPAADGEYGLAWPVANNAVKVLAGLELYRLTGNSTYRDAAATATNKVVDSQYLNHEWNSAGLTGFVMKDVGNTTTPYRYTVLQGMPYYAVAEMMAAHPGSSDWFKWFTFSKVYAQSYAKVMAANSGYEILPYTFGRGNREITSGSGSTFRYSYFQDQNELVAKSDGMSKKAALNAAALSNVAIQLGDLELEQVAHKHMEWLFGHNSIGRPAMNGVGELPNTSWFSHQWPITAPEAIGAIINGLDGDANDLGTTSNHWQRAETWRTNNSWFELAASLLGQQGSVQGTITNGGSAYVGSYSVVNRTTSATVHSGTTSGAGAFGPVNLPGGGRYRLVVGSVTKDFDLPSGKRRTMSVNLQDEAAVTAFSTSASSVTAGNGFTASVTVKNIGTVSRSFSVELKGFNVTGVSTQTTATLAAGASATLVWNLTATTADKPYVLLAIPESTVDDGSSLLGYVT